jgi:hypothetical protein
MNIAYLARLCHSHALLVESLSCVVGHSHIGILHQPTIQQKATNNCSSTSLPMITMHHHHILLILCIKLCDTTKVTVHALSNNKQRLDGWCTVILPIVGLYVHKFVHLDITATDVYN